MLYMPGSFSGADLDAWFRPDSKKYLTQAVLHRPGLTYYRERDKAISILEQLHIIVHKVDASRQTSYELYKSFQRSLRQALEGSGTHASFGVPSSQIDPNQVSIAFLDDYARQKWESILFYMVGSTVGLTANSSAGRYNGKDIGEGTITLLKIGDFVNSIAGRVSITKTGFQFLLQETNAQVWSLLIVYLRNSPQVRRCRYSGWPAQLIAN